MATARLKLRTIPKFLAAIFSGAGTSVRKDGLATYIDWDPSGFGQLGSYDPSSYFIAVQSSVDNSFGKITLAQLIASSQTQQIKTTAGDVNVSANDGLISVNKTVGAATTVNLPAASTKVGPVKVSDWKGDAGTNNITIAVVGSDKLNGNLTSWTIAADGGSIVLTPLSDGSGYAV
jgi:hypothetical protein